MEIQSLEGRVASFDKPKISIGSICCDSKPIELDQDHLLFVYNLSPLNLTLDGSQTHVPEGSVIKVNPNSGVSLESGKGRLYIIGFHEDETKYLNDLAKNSFFSGLEGSNRSEWESVRDKPANFVLSGEKNSEHIINLEDKVLIAPPSSRRNPSSNVGWHLMYARGSRAAGVASDYISAVRENEKHHYHQITHEIYVALQGSIMLDIDGKEYILRHNQAILTEPGERHSVRSIVEAPYRGIVLNSPSVPGDRVF